MGEGGRVHIKCQVDKLTLHGQYGYFHEQYEMWSVWKSHISFRTVYTKSMHSLKCLKYNFQ